MRKLGAVTVLAVSLLVVPALVGLTAANAQSSTSPPKNLKLVGDHWTAWDPPAAGPDAYIIVKGDTLWDLAERWLGDPFLWPQVWDENRYILDSHWIYPGDPLVVPGTPTVVSDKLPTEEETPDPEPEKPFVAKVMPPPRPAPPPLVPVADATDIYCSGYIDPEHTPSDLWIAGRETEKIHVAEGDVVYLNQGRNQGLQAGDEFGILRKGRDVNHPSTGSHLGSFIRRLGKVRVMITQDNTSTAVIENSCEDIRDSDELVVWEEIPVPMRRSMPEFDRYDVTPSGGATGQIVETPHEISVAAAGHIIHTDLGVASGVSPGDVLTLFIEREELPRLHIGQAVVLTVEPLTSTVKLTLTVRETSVGDSVEILQ